MILHTNMVMMERLGSIFFFNLTEYICRSNWFYSTIHANRKNCEELYKMEGFYSQRGWDKDVIRKRKNYFRQDHLPFGEGMGLCCRLLH